MKRSTKLLLSIVSIFILTIGIIGLVYGFGDKHGQAAADSEAHIEEQTKPDKPTKTEETKGDADKSAILESNEKVQADVSTSSEATSKDGHTSSKNSTVTSNQKSADNKNTPPLVKQETSSQQTKTSSNENSQPKANTEQKQDHTKQSEQPKESSDKQKPAASNVTYSIVADNGTILPATTVEIKDGDTVLDVLIKITREKKIPMSFRGGTGATAYIEGINNLFEFDKGQGSGWMYRVNGIFPNRGAGVIPLLNGDRIEWLYTLDLGKDLGAELKPFR